MNDLTRRQSILWGLGAALAAGQARAATPGAGYAEPDWLVSPEWLQQHRNDPGLKIVALTPQTDFVDGRIQGAVQINWPALDVTDTSPASIASWQKATAQKLGNLGLTSHDTIITYDDGSLFAARLWWVLDHFGHRDKRILNGGLPAWTAAHAKTQWGTSRTPTPAIYDANPNQADLATLEDVKASLGKSSIVLVDVRSGGEYRAGHIPGAINLGYRENALPAAPHLWKPAPALRRLYARADITPDKLVIPYCTTGVLSSVTFFTLRLLGYSNVRLYTGSWTEWSQHPELPKVAGDRPG